MIDLKRFIPKITIREDVSEKTGLPPGSLVYVGEKTREKVNISVIDYDLPQCTRKAVKDISEAFPLLEKDTVTWVNVDGLHDMGLKVRLHICGDTRSILDGMGRLGCEIVDLDYMAPIAEGRAAMGPDQVLLGNLDPVRCLRDGTPDSVRAAIAQCHHEAGPNFIVGAGCEVTRDTPHENLRALCEYAREAG